VKKLSLFVLLAAMTLLLNCRKTNHVPGEPSAPDGLSSGVNDTTYTFTSTATDPDNDDVAIRFDWGDGDTSDWTTPVRSGQPGSATHAWLSAGAFEVRAQSKDTGGATTGWSAGHQMKIAQAWSRVFGSYKASTGCAGLPTPDGGYIAAGYTRAYGAGEDDVWLIKTDASGNKLWDKTFGGPAYDDGFSVQLTSDGGYIVAGATGLSGISDWDVWLIKTDSAGNKLWDQTYGGDSGDFGYSVGLTSDGGYVITGYTVSYGAGGKDVWLIRTDASGNRLWDKTFGGAGDDDGWSVTQTADGGYLVASRTSSYGAGNADLWLIKTNASGNEIWNRTFGGAAKDEGFSVQATPDGGCVVAGCTASYGAGDNDVWLVKTDADGNKLWDKTFGGAGSDVAHSVVLTQDGGFAVAGYTSAPGAGPSDVWLIGTDASGNRLWDRKRGGGDDDVAQSIAQTPDGGYVVAGGHGLRCRASRSGCSRLAQTAKARQTCPSRRRRQGTVAPDGWNQGQAPHFGKLRDIRRGCAARLRSR